MSAKPIAVKSFSNKKTAKKQLEKWKNSLIDFSKRNQLLFFRPKSSLSIELKDPVEDIFRKIHLEGRSLGLLEDNHSNNDFYSSYSDYEDYQTESLDSDEEFSLNDLLPSEIETQNIDFANVVLTNKDLKSLNQSLSKLKSRSKASLQEQGVNIFYLALYFLTWQIEEEEAKSPLILLPVNIERKGLSGDYKINSIEEEIRINPTLAYKLYRDYQIDFSEIEEKLTNIESVEEFLLIKEEISKILEPALKNKFEITNESTISLFSFAKLSLYKDIELNEEKILQHPVIRQIAGEEMKKSEAQAVIDPNKAMQILSADSSQEEAIYAAKMGASFVLQGPPGTGKSQTIANIISESLAQNKKILFVSEKKAALDVVYKRLEASKLNNFCLELHGSGIKKSDIILGLKKSLEEIKSLALESKKELYIENISKLEYEIEKRIEAIHKIREPIKLSLFDLYSELSLIRSNLKDTQRLSFVIKNLESFDLEKLSSLDFFFKELELKEEILNHYPDYLWKGANVEKISFEFENEIKSNFIEFKNLLSKIKTYASPISLKYFNKEVNNIAEFRWIADASKLALESPFPNKDWFQKNTLEEVKQISLNKKIEHEEFSLIQNRILSKYKEGFLSLDHLDLISKFTDDYRGIFKFLNISYWKDSGLIKKLSLFNKITNIKDLVADLEEAALIDQKKKELAKDDAELSLVLGDFYKSFNTDWNETLTAIRWVRKILDKFELSSENASLPSTLISVISESKTDEDFEEFKSLSQNLLKAYELLNFHIKFYKSIFPNPNLQIENLNFNDLETHLNRLINEIHKLEDWAGFKMLQNKAEKLKISSFVNALVENSSKEKNNSLLLKERFLEKFYESWIDKIEIENPEIRSFNGEKQSLLIDRFNEMDKKLSEKTIQELAKKLALNWIEYASNPINQEALQILNQEINKKKRHKAIRKLIQEIPYLMQTLKPCWMMSPLSVSQLIDSKRLEDLAFDLVIFDEASQIRTEDAISSIYRGRQFILAGDSQQLPPTNFFNYISDNEENENDDENSFESVLDECAVFLDCKNLRWHYRSRHESLIKFSNQEFYDSSLISFPSAIECSLNLGIHFELIENAFYEKGSRSNKVEAIKISEAIVDHLESNPNKSLGVIAFSESQQMMIERELAKLLRKKPYLERHFVEEGDKENCFIKNLENVQGDERDVIFFSIGYAKDKSGNLSHNFGPLNKQGGHRRLNVAITRAREKIKIFSSISSADIDPQRSSALGLMLLKKYLSYAQTGELEINGSRKFINASKKSNSLILSIEKKLTEAGYKFKKNIGSSEYKIDLAIYSPQNDSNFILALEVDGENYVSAKSTRDRERLRREVLESLGWKVHRIYARDWVKNMDLEFEKLLSVLN